MSVLHSACVKHNFPAVRDMIRESPDSIHATLEGGVTPLHAACSSVTHTPHVRDQRRIIRALIQAGAHVDVSDGDGQTPLHYAAFSGYSDAAELLLMQKTAVDVEDAAGNTPLMLACVKQHADTVSVLLKYGADCNVRDREKRYLLTVVCKLGNDALVRDLLRTERICTSAKLLSIHTVAYDGQLSTLEMLLRNGVPSSMADSAGFTALYYACQNGRVTVAEKLLEYGASAEMCTASDGQFPLHVASLGGHWRCCKLLLTSAADVNVADADGCTPLHAAAITGKDKVIRLLLERSAKVNVKDKQDKNALYYSCAYGYIKCARYLLAHGADVHVICAEGFKAVHRAATHGHAEIVKLLLRHGARNEESEADGLTPLDYATDNDHHDTVKVIKQSMLVREMSDSGRSSRKRPPAPVKPVVPLYSPHAENRAPIYPGVITPGSDEARVVEEITRDEKGKIDDYLSNHGFARRKINENSENDLISAINASAFYSQPDVPIMRNSEPGVPVLRSRAATLTNGHHERDGETDGGGSNSFPFPVDGESDFPPHWQEEEVGIAKSVAGLLKAELYLTLLSLHGQPITMRIQVDVPEPLFYIHIAWASARYDAVVPALSNHQQLGPPLPPKALNLDTDPDVELSSSVSDLSSSDEVSSTAQGSGPRDPDILPSDLPGLEPSQSSSSRRARDSASYTSYYSRASVKLEQEVINPTHERHLQNIRDEFVEKVKTKDAIVAMLKHKLITRSEASFIRSASSDREQAEELFDIISDLPVHKYHLVKQAFTDAGQHEIFTLLDYTYQESPKKRRDTWHKKPLDDFTKQLTDKLKSLAEEETCNHDNHAYNLQQNKEVLVEQLDFQALSDIFLDDEIFQEDELDDIRQGCDSDIEGNQGLIEALCELSGPQFEYAIERLKGRGRHNVAYLLTTEHKLERPTHCWVLQNKLTYLTRRLDVDADLLAKLCRACIITHQDVRRILLREVGKDQVTCLVTLLRGKDETCFTRFISILDENYQGRVAEELRESQHSLV